MKICVIGAGVIGLSTAYRLQTETTPKCRVTIISKEFSPHLTSDVAGGLIEMYDYYETDPKKARKWTKDTYDYALKLALSPEAKRSGASCCRLIHFGHEPNQTALLADDVLEHRPLTQDELARYEGAVSGFQYLTAVCEGRIYLPWLLERFFQSGGQIRRSEVHSLEQLYDEFDIVVNCTGLGARDLVGDNNVYPVKGQLLKVKAPWLFQTKVDERIKDQCSFIIPGFETVTLGGTFEVGVKNKVIDPTVSQQIFSGCCKIEPSLVHAEVIGTVIGWRPARKGGVRLEKEQIKRKDGSNRLILLIMDSNRDTSSEIDWSLPSQFSTIQPDLDDAEELFSSTTNTDQTGGIGPLQGPHSQGTEEGSVGLQHSAMLDTSNPLQVKTADALMNEAEQCTTNCLHSLEAVKQAAFQNATHGNFTEALRLYKKHIDIIQKIAADSPNNLREIARSLARVCLCNWELGENDQALLALFRIKNIGDQLYERGVVNWYLCITEEEGMVRVEIKLGRDHRRIVRRWLFISKPKRNIVGYKDDGDGLEMI